MASKGPLAARPGKSSIRSTVLRKRRSSSKTYSISRVKSLRIAKWWNRQACVFAYG